MCELPPGRKAIGNKWAFKIKRNAEGGIDQPICSKVSN